ncbi:MAG: F0F1 ATP synthase subunit gamma [Rhodobiaceae bacterium]|jgi:F-type H+-transporting ATPase subunit gamma|nr:F0F1 ATP synthase subunit gamma [Rhodobiaceae bacterium]MDG2105976.1 F0F1 ATP synthase subunit gamma [Gammaproteobacteria bacterium]|tara:strand:+ start:601 stop:1470 length:870 start_codon:yes stop_codon:yes gene_type:complete
MAGSQEIRTQIKSIQNTQKITKAMEMVAASKMRKAVGQMEKARPYANKISYVMSHLANAHAEYNSVYFEVREVKKRAYIVVSSDRGLCGGLNNNLFKKVIESTLENKKNEIDTSYSVFGNKAAGFFQRIGGEVISQSTQVGDQPKIEDLLGTIKSTIDKFISKDVDEVYVAYNKFFNTVSQIPTIDKILPISSNDQEIDKEYSHYWDYLYEPDAKEVLESLFVRFIESLTYRAVVENIASEQASRMVAMKSSSDNASDLIDELQIIYNKNRQAAITQEISEIISGASAL